VPQPARGKVSVFTTAKDTSGFHTRRALWTFNGAAEKREIGIGLAVESPKEDRRFEAKCFWWLKRSGWHNIAAEVVKLIDYRAVY
jgi:hypothetical protein